MKFDIKLTQQLGARSKKLNKDVHHERAKDLRTDSATATQAMIVQLQTMPEILLLSIMLILVVGVELTRPCVQRAHLEGDLGH